MYRLPPALTAQGAMFEAILAHRSPPARRRTTPTTMPARCAGRRAEACRELQSALLDGRTIEVHYEPMIGGGWVVTHQDVTESIRAEARISHLAKHDALTDLPNRVLFQEKLDEAVAGSRAATASRCSASILDRFKSVNDTLGHGIGDALLKLVADRLRRRCARATRSRGSAATSSPSSSRSSSSRPARRAGVAHHRHPERAFHHRRPRDRSSGPASASRSRPATACRATTC
jgi:hypothetical protein